MGAPLPGHVVSNKNIDFIIKCYQRIICFLISAVKVVKVRAEAMQEASERIPSAMTSVFLGPSNQIKLACVTAERYCTEKLHMPEAICRIANYLYPEVKVIAGNVEVWINDILPLKLIYNI